MLDALGQSAGGAEANRLVGGACIGEVERAQRGAQPRPQRLALEGCLRQRRKQQRDAEVRVRGRDTPRRLHHREDGLAHAAIARARQLRADRDRAAQHVLVGGVVEVVAGRDVARLLGADLEHARQLGGTGDAVGTTNGRRRRMYGPSPSTRLTLRSARS